MNYEIFKTDNFSANIIANAYPYTPKAFMRSFGCQQNVNDGERIRGVLAGVGYNIIDEQDDADLIIFNTCAVRDHAEKKVFGIIGELKHLKAKNERLIIAICGCMVQQKAVVEKIKKSYPYVDIVFGPNGIDTLPTLIADCIKTKHRVLLQPSDRQDIIENVPIRREDKFVAWVPIMYGCDNFCSYCIVPYVRGRERSRRSADIFTEVENLVKNGYKEITLLGQNVNSYGKGLEENIDFADLLNLLCQIKGDYLIRFMTSHPKDATFKLIDTIAQNEHIAKNLHLPVQSGSDRILALMNRKYTRKDYMSLVNYAKEKIKDVTFSSDIIVGFPGETQEDFNETLSLVKEVSYTQLFTFIYSKRTGTKAAQFPDDTPQKEKSQRIMRLKEIQETATHNMFNKLVGTQQKILVTAVGRNANTFCGRLTNNCLVEFENKDDTVKLGDFTRVKITDTRNSVLIGQLIL